MCAGKTMKPLHEPVKVVIGACTFRRPDDLMALLESLIRLEPVPGVDLSVVIVDNDAQPSAQATVAAVRNRMPWPLHYAHETNPGIPFARNRVLREAGTEGFLAFVDDDETVDPGWLRQLIEVQRRTGAEFVQGPVVMSVEQERDRWWLASAFFRQNSFADLAPLKESWTNNVLIDLRFVHRHGLQFEESLRFEGGEDTLFFQDMVARGGQGRFAREALVYEVQPASRLRWRWGMMRQYRYGITRAKTALMRRAKGAAMGYCLLRGSAMIFLGLVKLPSALMTGRAGLAAGAALLARGTGVFAGLLGRNREEYGR